MDVCKIVVKANELRQTILLYCPYCILHAATNHKVFIRTIVIAHIGWKAEIVEEKSPIALIH
jgi:hypothetical protein